MTIEEAIIGEDLESVKTILEDEPSLIDEKDEDGILMAFLSAKTGNLKLLRYIVEYSRASMDITDPKHRNMLHYGTMSGNVDVCRYLTEKVGLSPLTGDIDRVTPMEMAYFYEDKSLYEYFVSVEEAPLEKMYKNPIRTGFFPDPSVVRVGEDYYMVNSSFIYFPCVPVSHSKDLIHWEIIGYAITNPEWAMLSELEGGRGFWAPDISYYKGKFYIAVTYRMNDTTNVYRKQFVVSAEKPEGPYSKPAIFDEDGIDPSIFNDDDGKRYMLLNRGARIFEINEDATEQISEAKLLYYGHNRRAPEGPHLLKKDGYYYLFEAEGGTGPGHRISVSRSRTLKGNYEPCPYNPIMTQRDGGAIIQRCGHGKPVETQNGQWYMVYLCGRKIGEGYSILGRETALDPITWTADGWPIVNNLEGPSCLQIKPDLPEMIYDLSDNDDFEGEKLSTNWTSPRPPEIDGIVISDSHLVLKGSKADLDTMAARNICLRRQREFNFTAVAKMEIPVLFDGQNAGMTCYYDENTFLKFGLFNENGLMKIKILEHIGDENKEIDAASCPYNDGYVYLKIVTEGLKREFYIGRDGEKFEKLATLDNVYYLCDEGLKKGKRFTGAMVGVYAFAGENAKLTAKFDTFNYQDEI